MDFIIEFIFGLFQSKDAKHTEYNDFINIIIFLLISFSIFVAFLWVCSKLGLFG
ncbi:hypothetical protein [Clostridium sp.]|uniref:hypothetical protein n=1 Tax=Clostridium sp. TaxID=1506 RepID=UPI001A646B07|nr:hypothetical protein [Clostridium sp.]MBK5242667.1 hypothetical protein [Clostridium sp.]